MVNTGILEYKDTDNLLTRVIWTADDVQSTNFRNRVLADGGIIESLDCIAKNERSYCGSDNPLSIRWKGDRYTTTAPSSATIRLLINDDEDRAHLEPIFNGGYTVTVYKDSKVFWKGQVTPTLGIEQYKQYPYYLNLNCNDGIKEAEDRQFLMIDFASPWPNKVSVLELIGRYINLNLYPRDIFVLNVASRLYTDNIYTALEDIYIDPRVFMEDDKDEYIGFDDVLDSLLGPLNLQLVQWKGEWWLLSLDAQWDAGKVLYRSYGIASNEFHLIGDFTKQLGILDLYKQDLKRLDREVEENAQIDFIPPWQTVTITQDFQINSNILPFMNRTGSFYYGHIDEGNTTTTQLEFDKGPFIVPPQSNHLRYWDGDLGTAPRIGNTIGGADFAPYKFNAGSLWLNSIKAGDPKKEVEFEYIVPNTLLFDRITFNLNTTSTYKGVPNHSKLQGKYAIKKYLEIIYTDKDTGISYWYWKNEDESDPFDGWSPDRHWYRWDYDELTLDIPLPDDRQFYGGTFKLIIVSPDDEHAYGNDYGVLYDNLQLGIVSSLFNDVFVYEGRYERVLPRSAVSSNSTPNNRVARVSGPFDEDPKEDRPRNTGAGNTSIPLYRTSDNFNWEDEIRVDINPNGKESLQLKYVWGLDIPEIDSYHELHLSSPYDLDGNHIVEFNKAGEDVTRPLLDWKARVFINENMEYTSALSGTYKSDNISPLQLINDFEGRVYKFTSGTWHDKQGFWDTTFTEFKALKNIPGEPYKCDFSPYDFNNDFCTFIDDPLIHNFIARVEDDGGTIESVGCLI